MREYFEAARRAYRRLRPSVEPSPALFDSFARLRPLVESGWEMPLVIHAVLTGAVEPELLSDWRPEAWLRELGVPRETIAATLDRVRDDWIAADEPGWLDHHRFYPGVIERLRGLAGGPTRVVVVTTKEGRFALTLLARQGVELAAEDVVGKEARRPKREILRELLARNAAGDATRLWFVEDRLRTLEDVRRDPALDGVKLFLAEWGYNTPEERAAVRRDARIVPLSLAQFGQDFAWWIA
ncbi:MAG: HAD family hydrolase [Candidatus Rokubacteria bacterium]|nr:HAD family hydrolase [Candidatus Rokubacteria bacterium]